MSSCLTLTRRHYSQVQAYRGIRPLSDERMGGGRLASRSLILTPDVKNITIERGETHPHLHLLPGAATSTRGTSYATYMTSPGEEGIRARHGGRWWGDTYQQRLPPYHQGTSLSLRFQISWTLRDKYNRLSPAAQPLNLSKARQYFSTWKAQHSPT
ncbi:hypothetical protein BC629DRAFT_1444372 [Irpex lacteus]|nr:hypothetical protein BC629DRAFT_1444372 [Irpex lacteus]